MYIQREDRRTGTKWKLSFSFKGFLVMGLMALQDQPFPLWLYFGVLWVATNIEVTK